MNSTWDLALTTEELDILIHFAEIGQDKIYLRAAVGDREVCRELDPVLVRLRRLQRESFYRAGVLQVSNGG